MKHTPGPWIVDALRSGSIGSVETLDGDCIAQAMQMLPRNDDPTQEHRRSNAILIAAAPELLEALQNLAYYVSRIAPPPYGHSCMWCAACVTKAKDAARAAIYKASGTRSV